MRDIYFEVTDVVEYAKRHPRVSGIQRVTARIIGSLARGPVAEHVHCLYWDSEAQEFFSFKPGSVFDGYEFDGEDILGRLGYMTSGFYPQKFEVKRYLLPYANRKIYRGWKKLELYLCLTFMRQRVAALGFKRAKKVSEKVKKGVVTHLNPQDALVYLGANWGIGAVVEFARAHRDAGGQVFQTIHDLIPVVAPQYFSGNASTHFAEFLDISRSYATHYLAVSNSTRKDLIGYFAKAGNVPPVSVVPLAHQFDGFARNGTFSGPLSSAVAELKGRHFVLCVGTIEVRKNGLGLLKAWRKLHESMESVPELVFAGKFGWKISEFVELLEHEQKAGLPVRVVSSPSDTDLAFLYGACLFTVYPSFYEGWGLPVGEAAWFGKFCVTSSVTSMPEVCGDLAAYVDPNSVADLARGIGDALSSPESLKSREQRIRASELRTWADVASRFYEVVSSANDAGTALLPAGLGAMSGH